MNRRAVLESVTGVVGLTSDCLGPVGPERSA